MLCYCDSSALLKLFVEEIGTRAMRQFLAGDVEMTSSVIAQVEVLRGLARRGGEDDSKRAAAYLDSMTMLALGESVLKRAAAMKPVALRSLDAIHLASALQLSPPPDAFLSYDERLLEAARAIGLPALSPGADEVHEP